MRLLQPAVWFAISVLIFSLASSAQGNDAQSLDARRQQLNKLIAEEWEYELRESPELATVIGDYRYNDRWSDGSLAHVAQTKKDLQAWLARFEVVDTAGFPEQERLNKSLMARDLRLRIEGIDLKNYEMPVDQFYGIHLLLGLIVGTWYVFNGFQASTSQGLLTLLFAVVGYFLWILYVRVALEFLVAMFRTAENIARASGSGRDS